MSIKTELELHKKWLTGESGGVREQQEDGDADYAVMKFNRRANGWLHLDWKLDVEIDGVTVAKEMV